ncbi:MAG: DUF1700 domain-containing protein [Oligoflexia bacterium]|nr:DUF1700 domain-containing protein [Oligoflexia bacterium]
MPTHPKLEAWLTSLDRALQPLPVSERADILTEFKSHVQAAQERDPGQAMDSILTALGEPETVANRYLLERGRAPVKPPISPIVKWIVIGVLGSCAMVLAFAAFVITRFAGSIEFDSDSIAFNSAGGHSEGVYPWKAGESRPIVIEVTNAKMDFSTSETGALTWSCKGARDGKVTTRETPERIALDFGGQPAVRCSIEVPPQATLQLDNTNGKLTFSEPRFHVSGRVTNAKIAFQPDPGEKYKYAFDVQNGKLDSFESSHDPSAFLIRLKVVNGLVVREE